MTELTSIHHPSEVPAFETEAEEAAFWATHAIGKDYPQPDLAEVADILPPVDRTRRSRPTSIRLGGELERRLRHLAQLKHTPYQTLLKEFVQERVYEEEKRHGVV